MKIGRSGSYSQSASSMEEFVEEFGLLDFIAPDGEDRREYEETFGEPLNEQSFERGLSNFEFFLEGNSNKLIGTWVLQNSLCPLCVPVFLFSLFLARFLTLSLV